MSIILQITQEHMDSLIQAANTINKQAGATEKSYIMEIIVAVVGSIVTFAIVWGVQKFDKFLTTMDEKIVAFSKFTNEKEIVIKGIQDNCKNHQDTVTQHGKDIIKLDKRVLIVEDHLKIQHA